MKRIFILIIVTLIPGCSLQTLQTKTMQTLREVSKHVPLSEYPDDSSSSSLYFEVADKNDWEIMQPPAGQWRDDAGRTMYGPGPSSLSYLPDYFPSYSSDGSGGIGYNNFFYALYRLDNGEELAMWIISKQAPTLWKRNWRDFWSNNLPRIDDLTSMKTCENKSIQSMLIMINRSDVYFDSSKVDLFINNKVIDKNEVVHKYIRIDKSYINNSIINNVIVHENNYYIYKNINHDIYYLIDPDGIDKKKRIETGYDILRKERELLYKYSLYRYSSGSYKYSSFAYIFNATCQDLEDAVLVVDGLTYHGEPLPPLKVRMKYYDYSIIPEYMGSVQKGLEANIEGQPDATP